MVAFVGRRLAHTVHERKDGETERRRRPTKPERFSDNNETASQFPLEAAVQDSIIDINYRSFVIVANRKHALINKIFIASTIIGAEPT